MWQPCSPTLRSCLVISQTPSWRQSNHQLLSQTVGGTSTHPWLDSFQMWFGLLVANQFQISWPFPKAGMKISWRVINKNSRLEKRWNPRRLLNPTASLYKWGNRGLVYSSLCRSLLVTRCYFWGPWIRWCWIHVRCFLFKPSNEVFHLLQVWATHTPIWSSYVS